MELTVLLLAPLATALTEVVKRTELVPQPQRFMPVVALGLGVGLALGTGFSWVEGLMVGLSSAGVYDLTKKTVIKTLRGE